MSLVGLQDAIVSSITSNVTQFRSVQAHGGRFNEAEIRRIATMAPACLVAMLGGPIDRDGGSAGYVDMQIIAFVLTAGTSAEGRDRAAPGLAALVAQLAVTNDWDYEDANAPGGIALDNLYSGEISRLGVALWAVRWAQRIEVTDYDASELDDLHLIHVETDLAPKDGVIDHESDIWLNGEFMSAYGHINVSSEVATAISVADTYQKLSGTTELNLYDDFDMPVVGRLRHTGTAAKPFLVSASVSVGVSGDAKVTLAIAKGGVVDEDTEIEQDITAAGGSEAFSLKHIVSLDEDEYVEVWVKADDTINVTATKLNLVAAAT